MSPTGWKFATGEEGRTTNNSSREKEEAGKKWKNAQLWTYLVLKVKSDAINNIS